MVLDMEINADEVSSETQEISDALDRFLTLLRQELDGAVESVAEDFRDEVKTQIEQSGIDSDTGELLNSWQIRQQGDAQYRVRSTVDHALYLEVGTEPHTISSDSGWLKFIPEDPSPYPKREFTATAAGDVEGDFGKEGLVVSPMDPLFEGGQSAYFAKSVRHPGNEAYEYFENAVQARPWNDILAERINDAIDDAINKAGLA